MRNRRRNLLRLDITLEELREGLGRSGIGRATREFEGLVGHFRVNGSPDAKNVNKLEAAESKQQKRRELEY